MNECNVSFKNNGKLKLLIIVGTRPEIIRLAAVINKARKYFDTILAHTGQNYDYNLNGVFFKDLQLDDPDVYMNAVGADLGETMGNIIAASYKLMVEIKPDAVLVLGDTRTSACRRKPIEGLLTLSAMLIWHIPSTQGVILPTQDFPKSAPMLPVRRWRRSCTVI